MTKLLYSRKEASVLLGISLASTEALTTSGQLGTIRVGRSIKIPADVLFDFARTGTSNKTVSGKPLHALWARKAQ